MPTKRRKIPPKRVAIPPEAIEAWRTGDDLALFAALKLPPWHVSPFDANLRHHPEPDGTAWSETWPRAVELRQELLKMAGPAKRWRK